MDRREALKLMAIAGGFACACPFIPALAAEKALRLREFYGRGITLSDLARKLNGKRISVMGYMAPPLKAEAKFFVLTKLPMSFCPFCETEAESPDNIMVVYTSEIIEPVPYNYGIIVTGKLEIGAYQDPENNFWSKLRLVDASFRRL